jgi:hypothetical protein
MILHMAAPGRVSFQLRHSELTASSDTLSSNDYRISTSMGVLPLYRAKAPCC